MVAYALCKHVGAELKVALNERAPLRLTLSQTISHFVDSLIEL